MTDSASTRSAVAGQERRGDTTGWIPSVRPLWRAFEHGSDGLFAPVRRACFRIILAGAQGSFRAAHDLHGLTRKTRGVLRTAPKRTDWPPQGAAVAGVTRASQVRKRKADIQSSPQGEISRRGAAVCSPALMARAARSTADGTRREGPSWSARSQVAIGSAPAPRQPHKARHSGKGFMVSPLVGRNHG
jgi:hypothetical protein